MHSLANLVSVRRPRAVVGAVGAVCASGLVALTFAPIAAHAATETFNTLGCSSWNVPAGVTSVDITATGSAGQSVAVNFPDPPPPASNLGGAGDVVSGTLSGLTAGQALWVCVNSAGGSGGTAVGPGVASGGNGGGASGVSLGSNFGTPVLIAGITSVHLA